MLGLEGEERLRRRVALFVKHRKCLSEGCVAVGGLLVEGGSWKLGILVISDVGVGEEGKETGGSCGERGGVLREVEGERTRKVLEGDRNWEAGMRQSSDDSLVGKKISSGGGSVIAQEQEKVKEVVRNPKERRTRGRFLRFGFLCCGKEMIEDGERQISSFEDAVPDDQNTTSLKLNQEVASPRLALESNEVPTERRSELKQKDTNTKHRVDPCHSRSRSRSQPTELLEIPIKDLSAFVEGDEIDLSDFDVPLSADPSPLNCEADTRIEHDPDHNKWTGNESEFDLEWSKIDAGSPDTDVFNASLASPLPEFKPEFTVSPETKRLWELSAQEFNINHSWLSEEAEEAYLNPPTTVIGQNRHRGSIREVIKSLQLQKVSDMGKEKEDSERHTELYKRCPPQLCMHRKVGQNDGWFLQVCSTAAVFLNPHLRLNFLCER